MSQNVFLRLSVLHLINIFYSINLAMTERYFFLIYPRSIYSEKRSFEALTARLLLKIRF